MNFNEAITALEEGKKIRRMEWGFATESYLELKPWYGTKIIYIVGRHSDEPNLLQSYGMQYDDIKATDWEIV